MKCPKCGGNGKEYWNGNVFCNTGFECDKCNGTGEIELVQTNDEWRKTCSTEEFAIWLRSVRGYCSYINNCKQCPTKCKNGGWEGWLKQPHTIKE